LIKHIFLDEIVESSLLKTFFSVEFLRNPYNEEKFCEMKVAQTP